MAVAQGYGKTVTSGSVFAYDTGDTRNSYIGEPTTNLVLFNVTVANFSNDYGANLVSQTADYNVTYRGRPTLRVNTVGQWNLYRAGRPGNFTAISSTIYTFSWKMKWSDGKVPSFVVGYIYTDAELFYPGVTVTPLEDGWYLCQTTGGGDGSPIWLAGFNSNQTGTCYVTDWQVETKSHATPFTTEGTTRSATQGLLPLVGNSTLDLSNVSFDSNAQITFDGTDDFINCGNDSSLTIPRTVTMELCFKVAGFGSPWTNVFGKMNADGDSSTRCYTAFINSSGYLHFVTADSSGQEHLDSTNFINTGVWYHWVGTINRNTGVLSQYVNGALNSVGSVRTTDIVINSDPLRVGYAGNAYQRYNGSVAVAKIYNRALSAGEVRQNYLHYKTRFNLS